MPVGTQNSNQNPNQNPQQKPDRFDSDRKMPGHHDKEPGHTPGENQPDSDKQRNPNRLP